MNPHKPGLYEPPVQRWEVLPQPKTLLRRSFPHGKLFAGTSEGKSAVCLTNCVEAQLRSEKFQGDDESTRKKKGSPRAERCSHTAKRSAQEGQFSGVIHGVQSLKLGLPYLYFRAQRINMNGPSPINLRVLRRKKCSDQRKAENNNKKSGSEVKKKDFVAVKISVIENFCAAFSAVSFKVSRISVVPLWFPPVFAASKLWNTEFWNCREKNLRMEENIEERSTSGAAVDQVQEPQQDQPLDLSLPSAPSADARPREGTGGAGGEEDPRVSFYEVEDGPLLAPDGLDKGKKMKYPQNGRKRVTRNGSRVILDQKLKKSGTEEKGAGVTEYQTGT